jgi:hypothetical protein
MDGRLAATTKSAYSIQFKGSYSRLNFIPYLEDKSGTML